MKYPETYLRIGAYCPYDGRPGHHRPWNERIALGVIADLCDRRGMKHAIDDDRIDKEVRVELIAELAQLIKLGVSQAVRGGELVVAEMS